VLVCVKNAMLATPNQNHMMKRHVCILWNASYLGPSFTANTPEQSAGLVPSMWVILLP